VHDDEGVLAVRHEEPGGRNVHGVLAAVDRRDQEAPLAEPFVVRAVGREPVGDLDLNMRGPSVTPRINTPSKPTGGREGADRSEDVAGNCECFGCRHHEATPSVYGLQDHMAYHAPRRSRHDPLSSVHVASPGRRTLLGCATCNA
jgi:hypothetical protein